MSPTPDEERIFKDFHPLTVVGCSRHSTPSTTSLGGGDSDCTHWVWITFFPGRRYSTGGLFLNTYIWYPILLLRTDREIPIQGSIPFQLVAGVSGACSNYTPNGIVGGRSQFWRGLESLRSSGTEARWLVKSLHYFLKTTEKKKRNESWNFLGLVSLFPLVHRLSV